MAKITLKEYRNVYLIVVLLTVIFQGAYEVFFYGMKGDPKDAIISFASIGVVLLFGVAAYLILVALVKFGVIKNNDSPNDKKEQEGKDSEEKKIWKAKREKPIKEVIDETDFEESRRCLLNSYHSYIQNHVGYLIAIVVGILGLVSSYEYFIKIVNFFKIPYGNYIFIFLGVLIFGTATMYDFLRISYWTTYANVANAISIDNAIDYFNNYNKEENNKEKKLAYFNKAPNTAIIQHAIIKQIQSDFKHFSWYYQKLVLRNIRPRPPTEDSSNS
ncbi:MAG: hypothetical protein ABR909_01545 [Candidatus Bathyarchaeia archaeon]|jgi:hypothetical protein